MERHVDSARIRIHAGDTNPDFVATALASVCRRTARHIAATVLMPAGSDIPETFRAGNLTVEFRHEGLNEPVDIHEVALGVHNLLIGRADQWLNESAASPMGIFSTTAAHREGHSASGRADVEWGRVGTHVLDWSGGAMPWQNPSVCGFQLWLRELTNWEELRNELSVRARDHGRTPAYVIHQAEAGVRREDLLGELDDSGFAVEPIIGIDPNLPVDFRASVAILLEWFGWPATRARMAQALGHRWAWLDFLAKSDASYAVFCEDTAHWRCEASGIAELARQAGSGPWRVSVTGDEKVVGDGRLCYVLSREAAALLTKLDLAVPAAFGGCYPWFAELARYGTIHDGVSLAAEVLDPGIERASLDKPIANRFLIGVCSRLDHDGRRQAIRTSWMPDERVPSEVKVHFISEGGRQDPDEASTEKVARLLSRDRREPNLLEFVRSAVAEVDFDWLLLCEDDAYLVTNRLDALAVGDAVLVVCGRILEPSGGGICMMRRSIAAEIAAGSIPVDNRAGIGELARAVAATGISLRKDFRLCHCNSGIPGWDDDLAGCHHVPEHLMGLIHKLCTLAPIGLAEIRHPRWSDHVHLHPEGLFRRKTVPSLGRWAWNRDTGELTLAWFGKHPETFLTDHSGVWHLIPRRTHPPLPVAIPPGKTVFVHASGRTGNQLFQYAYGLHLCRQFGCRLSGDLRLLVGMEGIPESVTARGMPPLRTALIKVVDDQAAARCLADAGIDGIDLHGCFQTYGHFDGISAELKAILGNVAKQDAIGIHIRRGDYLASGHDMGMPVSYFTAGARKLVSILGETVSQIVVFSDDPEWCEHNLVAALARVLPVRIYSGNGRDALAEMKSMRGMVIVNSTFGWWGAWLADGPVVVPRSWKVPHGAFETALGCTRSDWIIPVAGDCGEHPQFSDGPPVRFEPPPAALAKSLEWLRLDDPGRFAIESSLQVLADVLRALHPAPGEALLEFGGGGFSTPLLLSTGARVFSVEQGPKASAPDNAAWVERLRNTLGHASRWRLMYLPGNELWRAAVYPAGPLFCFVNANGDCRNSVVEFMLARAVPVIAANDREAASLRFDLIDAPARYSVHDYCTETTRSRIWSSHAPTTAALDCNPAYSMVADPSRRVDLRRIPVILVGAGSPESGTARHRYVNHPDHAAHLHPHTESVPRMPGGNTLGCSAAHRMAATRALERHPGVPVLLLEDDAVMSPWFSPILEDVPGDADIVWLGCSNGYYQGSRSPCVAKRDGAAYLRLHGVCQGSHSVLLATDRGKRAWQACCGRAAGGEAGGSTDLVCSLAGIDLCRQYVLATPMFFQPDHPATLCPLAPQAGPAVNPAEGPCRISATRLIIHRHSVLAGLLHGRDLKIVDLGAGTGDFTDEMADIFCVGHAVLVEPQPGTFRRLRPAQGRILLNKAVVPRASRGTVLFTEDLDSPHNGSLVFSNFARKATYRVETATLEEIANLFGATEMIDVLKMDIEGAECNVLLEAEESVLTRFGQISVEFHDFIDCSMRPMIERVEERLCSLGFAVLKRGTKHQKGSTHYDTLFVRIPDTGVPSERAVGGLRPERDILGTWDQFNNGVPVCRKTFLPKGRMACGGLWRIESDGTVVFGPHRVRPTSGGALAGSTSDGTWLYFVRTRSADLPNIPDADPFGILARMIAEIAPINLERFGPARDGGYAVPAGACFDLVVTVGVGGNIEFETQYALSHPSVRFELFDHTVSGLPAPLPGAVFHRMGAGRGPHLRPLPQLLENCLRPTDRMVLLKMDCEGGEWDCDLEDIPFDRIHTLVIEIHGLLKPAGKSRMARVLAAISRHFSLVHASPNNCTAQGTVHWHALTDCLELTLVNRCRIEGPPAGTYREVRRFANSPSRSPAILETAPQTDWIPTIVSAFFDLGAFLKGHEGTRDAATYRRWMFNFSRIENPLVFFAETEEDLELMAAARRRCHHPTVIVPTSRAVLGAFSLLGTVAESIRCSGYPKSPPNTTVAEYSCVQHAKYELVKCAISAGLVGTAHCCWMDCGRIFDFLALDSGLLYQLQHSTELGCGIHYTRARTFEPLSLDAIQVAEGGAGAFCHAGGFFYGKTNEMSGWCDTYLQHALRYQSEGWVFTDQTTLHAMLSEGLAQGIHAHPFPDRWFGLCDHLLRVVRPPPHNDRHD